MDLFTVSHSDANLTLAALASYFSCAAVTHLHVTFNLS